MPVTKLPKNTLVEAIRGTAQRMQQPTDDNVLKAQLLGFLGNILENQLPTEAEQILPMPAAMVVAPRLPRIANPLPAYHASPYNFDRFDSSKIGTGQGAASFSEGLYFAQARPVAEEYRRGLSAQDFQRKVAAAYNEFSSPADAAAALKYAGLSKEQLDLVQALDQEGWLGFDYPHQAVGAALSKDAKNFDLSPATLEAIKKQGRLYQVNLHVDPNELLDWDKPLSQQHKKIQQAWQNTRQQLPQDAAENLGNDLSLLYRRGITPREFINTMSSLGHGGNLGEKLLHKQGVQGVKYFDRVSRAAQEGTRNYVIYDDKVIEIVKKLGIAAAVGAGLINEGQARQLQAQGYE